MEPIIINICGLTRIIFYRQGRKERRGENSFEFRGLSFELVEFNYFFFLRHGLTQIDTGLASQMRFSIAECTIQKLLVTQASTHLIHCPVAALGAYVKPGQDFASLKIYTVFLSAWCSRHRLSSM